MDYLERNAAVMAELRDKMPELKKGVLVGETHKTQAYSLGSFFSDVAGRELHLLLKAPSRSRDLTTSLLRSLPVIDKIATEIPEMIPQLPFFLGGVVDPSDDCIGLITEDFSGGGKHKSWELYYRNTDEVSPLMMRLKDLFRYSDEDVTLDNLLGGMAIIVGRGEERFRRLVDFDKATKNFHNDELEKFYRWQEVFDNVDRFTLKLPYPLT